MARSLARPALAALLGLALPLAAHDHGKDHDHDRSHDHDHDHHHDHAHGDDGQRAHGAHVHGVAWLDVALDGATLEVRLQGTGADIAGLEGAPADAADVAKVDAARKALADASGLFAFEPAGACRAEGVAQVEPPASALLAPGAAGAGDQGHGDWSATYAFACASPPAAVQLALFDRFPELTEVKAQVLAAGGQTAVEATPAQRRIALDGAR
jgi:hypothetical protein